MKIQFRLDKRSKVELKPIMMHINHNGSQIKRSTGLKIESARWEYGIPTDIFIELSVLRETLEKRLVKLEEQLGREVEIDEIKIILNTSPEKEKESTQITVLITKYIKAKEKIYSGSRIHGYNRLLDLINEFLSDNDFKDDHGSINKTWVLSFIDFLCYAKEYANSTTESLLKRLRAVLNFYDLKLQFKMADVMQGMRGKKIDNEVPFLTLDELDTIFRIDYSWDIPIKEEVRDLFLFCAFTGMRFSESQIITKDNFFYNGKMSMMRYTTSKNGSTIEVPLNNTCEAMVRNYNGELPKVSNARANTVLHGILEELGFTKEIKTVHYQGKNRVEKLVPLYDILTFHDSRKAFGCNLIEGGLDMQSVADLMGISIDTLQKWYSKSNKQDRNLKALEILNT